MKTLFLKMNNNALGKNCPVFTHLLSNRTDDVSVHAANRRDRSLLLVRVNLIHFKLDQRPVRFRNHVQHIDQNQASATLHVFPVGHIRAQHHILFHARLSSIPQRKHFHRRDMLERGELMRHLQKKPHLSSNQPMDLLLLQIGHKSPINQSTHGFATVPSVMQIDNQPINPWICYCSKLDTNRQSTNQPMDLLLFQVRYKSTINQSTHGYATVPS